MSDQAREAPIEVEVERLDPREEEPGAGPGWTNPRPGAGAAASAAAWGPIVAGLLLDLADVVTPNPRIGLAVGFVVGLFAGTRMGLPIKGRLMLAGVGAAYCSLAATTTLPIGTVVGLLYRTGIFGRRT